MRVGSELTWGPCVALPQMKLLAKQKVGKARLKERSMCVTPCSSPVPRLYTPWPHGGQEPALILETRDGSPAADASRSLQKPSTLSSADKRSSGREGPEARRNVEADRAEADRKEDNYIYDKSSSQ